MSTLLAELDVHIIATETLLDHLRAVRLIIATERSGAAKPTAKPALGQRRKPSGIRSRVIDVLREHGEPMKPAAIVTACKAPDWQVRLTLKELAADGKIVSAGATNNKTYALKGGAK